VGLKLNQVTGQFDLVGPNGGLGIITSVSNADGTLTISPTTGAVVASVNTAHNFSWTGSNIWYGASQFINADVTKTPTVPTSGSIGFTSDGSGFFANGTTYSYYIYAYYFDGVNYAYEPLGYYLSSTDPNDSNNYYVDLSWSGSTDANGYIIFDFNNTQYLDAGNVGVYQITPVTSWTAGSPTLTPNTITIPGTPLWSQYLQDYAATDNTILKIAGDATDHLRLRWNYGTLGLGALKFEDSAGNLKYLYANIYGTTALFTGNVTGASIIGTVYPTGMSANQIAYTSVGSALTGISTFTFNGTNMGVGVATGLAKIHSQATTEQLRLSYDASNRWTYTIGSTGLLSMQGVGTGGALTVTPTAGQNINFALSTTGDFIVNTTQFVVDTSAVTVGIGLAAPTSKLHIDAGTGTLSALQFTAGTTTGQLSTDGYHVGITATGIAELRQKENLALNFYTNNSLRVTVAATGETQLVAGTVSLPALTFIADPNTGIYNTADVVAISAGGVNAGYFQTQGTFGYFSIGGTGRVYTAALGKVNIFGTGTASDCPILGIWHNEDVSTSKNAGIITKTRMTSRYLTTSQNIGQNDNSFGNPGVIQWTAWEYTNNTYTTFANPNNEFTGWSYQYYKDNAAYVNLFRIHTSGIYIGAAAASSVPAAKLHVLSTTEQVRTAYDLSNYYTTTVGSTGLVTFDAAGSGSAFTFNDRLGVYTSPSAAVNIGSHTTGYGTIDLYTSIRAISSTGFALAGNGSTHTILNVATGGSLYFNVNASQIGLWNGTGLFVGTTGTVSAAIHAVKTTEQLRLAYDASNYFSTTVGVTGGVTFDAVGAGSAFTFSDKVNLSVRANFASVAGTAVEGDVWSDSTQKALQTFTNGIEQTLSGCIFVQTADKTIANTVTETTLFGTGVGTITLPANFWVAGKTVRMTISGDFADTGTPTGDVKIKFGATTLSDSTALAFAALSGTEQWDLHVIITCRTTGGTGTLETNVIFEYETTTGSSPIQRFDIAGTSTVVDTTASGALDATFQWGTASASNTITSEIALVEVLN